MNDKSEGWSSLSEWAAAVQDASMPGHVPDPRLRVDPSFDPSARIDKSVLKSTLDRIESELGKEDKNV